MIARDQNGTCTSGNPHRFCKVRDALAFCLIRLSFAMTKCLGWITYRGGKSIGLLQ